MNPRRLLGALVGGAVSPGETLSFLLSGAFGIGLAVAYQVLTRELAGTVLLVGFGLAALLVALVTSRGRRAALGGGGAGAAKEAAAGVGSAAASAAHVPDHDRPLLDESGRIPAPTLAPLALALGVAVAITSTIFGAAPLIVGVVPAAWGAQRWLRDAVAELAATSRADTGEGNPGAGASR